MTPATYSSRFEDFDSPSVLTTCVAAIQDPECSNYVLDFDKDAAQCALNINLEELQDALEARDARIKQRAETRWINLERPETQQELINLLAIKYGFSNRLRHSMLADPLKPQPRPRESQTGSSRTSDFMHPRKSRQIRRGFRQPNGIADSEKRAVSVEDPESPVSPATDMRAATRLADLNHYRLVSDVWHYMSVDLGYNYTCIGYNSIYGLKAPKNASNKDHLNAKRVWNWLVLCRDGTIISIRENPFPHRRANLEKLKLIRSNFANVFRQLSKASSIKPRSELFAVQIRATDEPASNGESRVTEDESPSLLLYYLFDDWRMSYGLIARDDEQFGRQLDRLRDDMFQSPQLEHIHRLHYYGRQLGILKRLYKSYGLIIERILKEPQSPVALKTREDAAIAMEDMSRDVSEKVAVLQRTTYGVSVPPAAAVRFERLNDRINLYVLSEIQACLDEKESLMTLNFNLITLKESSYIERLTRITILLAKISILFIPVTFMSSYFTIPFIDIEYTPPVYWVAFAVIFTLSFVGIVVFGQLSGTQEGKPIYTSVTQAALNRVQKLYRSVIGHPLVARSDTLEDEQ